MGLKFRCVPFRVDWPPVGSMRAQLKNADHTAWAMHDAARYADVIHLNDVVGVPFTTFTNVPSVLTIHHPHEPELSEQYARYPDIEYVAIARWLACAIATYRSEEHKSELRSHSFIS